VGEDLFALTLGFSLITFLHDRVRESTLICISGRMIMSNFIVFLFEKIIGIEITKYIILA
jgi:hypothetical protein